MNKRCWKIKDGSQMGTVQEAWADTQKELEERYARLHWLITHEPYSAVTKWDWKREKSRARSLITSYRKKETKLATYFQQHGHEPPPPFQEPPTPEPAFDLEAPHGALPAYLGPQPAAEPAPNFTDPPLVLQIEGLPDLEDEELEPVQVSKRRRSRMIVD
jgi:hypothetical protein